MRRVNSILYNVHSFEGWGLIDTKLKLFGHRLVQGSLLFAAKSPQQPLLLEPFRVLPFSRGPSFKVNSQRPLSKQLHRIRWVSQVLQRVLAHKGTAINSRHIEINQYNARDSDDAIVVGAVFGAGIGNEQTRL